MKLSYKLVDVSQSTIGSQSSVNVNLCAGLSFKDPGVQMPSEHTAVIDDARCRKVSVREIDQPSTGAPDQRIHDCQSSCGSPILLEPGQSLSVMCLFPQSGHSPRLDLPRRKENLLRLQVGKGLIYRG